MKVYATQVSLVINKSISDLEIRQDGKPLKGLNKLVVSKPVVIRTATYTWRGVISELEYTANTVKVTLTQASANSAMFDGEYYVIEAQLDGLTSVIVTDLTTIYKVVGYHGTATSLTDYKTLIHEKRKGVKAA